MSILKIAATTLVATTIASASFAGSMSAPVADPIVTSVMIDDEATTGSSASGSSRILLPLLGLVLIAALIASDDS